VSPVIEKDELPPFVFKKSYREVLTPLSDVMARMEKDYITKVLEVTMWNKTKAAEILGISRKNLWQKIRAHNITE
jgi:transcriptional regulator of acetoin/glycerol metabolism